MPDPVESRPRFLKHGQTRVLRNLEYYQAELGKVLDRDSSFQGQTGYPNSDYYPPKGHRSRCCGEFVRAGLYIKQVGRKVRWAREPGGVGAVVV